MSNTTFLWIVEHREWVTSPEYMDTVIMHVASSHEKAVRYMQETEYRELSGWYVVYAEPLDREFFDDDIPEKSFEIYDLEGNQIEEQPLPESPYDKGYREGFEAARKAHEQNVQDTYNNGYRDGLAKGTTRSSGIQIIVDKNSDLIDKFKK